MYRLAYRSGLRLYQIRFIRKAVNDHADVSGMTKAMIRQMIVGLLLIAISNAVTWPSIGLITAESVRTRRPLIALIGVPLAYGITFVCCGIGMAMAGGKGARVFLRWRARLWVEWLLAHGTQPMTKGS